MADSGKGLDPAKVRLHLAVCKALRAWIFADAEGLVPSEVEERRSRARSLTGLAINCGLLGSLKRSKPC